MTRARAALATILLALLVLLPRQAAAQNQFTTTDGSKVIGVVMMCLNGSGVALPANQAGQCPPGTFPLSINLSQVGGASLALGAAGAPQSLPVAQNFYQSAGPMQPAVPIPASTALPAVPTGTTFAVACARGGSANYSPDGVTVPTQAVGQQLQQNGCLPVYGPALIASIRFIQQTPGATLDVAYYK